MVNSARWFLALGLVFSMSWGSWAQSQVVVQNSGYFTSGMETPRFPPAGDWAEIVTVTPKWLVIQNSIGQQFPVAIDAIGQFVIRWPSTVDNISPNALIEAIGVDLSTNQVGTDHIDYFEGSATRLVVPTFQRLIGYNRTPTAYDYNNMNTYGVTTYLLPGEDQIPDRHHIVGSLAGRYPLQIAAPGNNALTVVPTGNGMAINEVTIGSANFLRAGDLVYLIPNTYTPRTMILSQMIAYKTMPLSQFVP